MVAVEREVGVLAVERSGITIKGGWAGTNEAHASSPKLKGLRYFRQINSTKQIRNVITYWAFEEFHDARQNPFRDEDTQNQTDRI